MIRALVDNLSRINGFPGRNAPPSSAKHASTAKRNTQIYITQPFLAPRNAALPHRAGSGVIAGSVKVKGTPDTPVSRPVVAFDFASMLPLAQTTSATDGSYRFANLPTTPVFVVSFDTTGLHRAVIADNLTPEPM